jgi:hypothetical protein
MTLDIRLCGSNGKPRRHVVRCAIKNIAYNTEKIRKNLCAYCNQVDTAILLRMSRLSVCLHCRSHQTSRLSDQHPIAYSRGPRY